MISAFNVNKCMTMTEHAKNTDDNGRAESSTMDIQEIASDTQDGTTKTRGSTMATEDAMSDTQGSTSSASNDNTQNMEDTMSSEQSKQVVCVDWEANKLVLDKAKTIWTNLPCYEYTLQCSGDIEEEWKGPFTITVKNGVVISPDLTGPAFPVTIDQIMDHVHKLCIAKCPKTGASQCTLVLADEGYLVSTDIDMDISVAGDHVQYSYNLANFTVLDCTNLATADMNEDKDIHSSSMFHIPSLLALILPFVLAIHDSDDSHHSCMRTVYQTGIHIICNIIIIY